ncbi:ABC transporter ATP-binding protein [Myxococcota bacterium]
MQETLVELHELSKFYPGLDRPAVDKLSLTLRRGDIFGFVGPNGAGKTTTIKMLLNLARPDGGSGKIFGKDIVRESVAIRRRMGFMSGEVKLWNSMRGTELLRFLLSLHGGGDQQKVQDLCQLFDVPLERKIKTYSTGQKQMVAMLAALGHDSDLLILDEPTKGLDPSKKAQFLEQVRSWRDHGGAVIISSHVLSEIEAICTRVGFIREGRLLGEEEIDAIRSELNKSIFVSFDNGITKEQLKAIPGVSGVSDHGLDWLLRIEGDGRDVLHRLADMPVRSLRYCAATLDEIYEKLFMGRKDR